MNEFTFFVDPRILKFAVVIKRVDSNEFHVTYARGEDSLDVRYKRCMRDFEVALDVDIIGPERFWIQGNTTATQAEKEFWYELSDSCFDYEQERGENYKYVVLAAMQRLTKPS